jgi:putative glycosyltransferase (TIGR04348 family)
LNVLIIGPALLSKGRGNRTTALRWGGILADMGHEVLFADEYDREDCDLLIALHAIWSAESVETFRDAHPDRPVIVALTGTDTYGLGSMFDESGRAKAHGSMAAATALVAFHDLAIHEIPELQRPKAWVISQSAQAPAPLSTPRDDLFEACVVGELREVKDPFRAALAARRLPSESRVRVLHAGAAGSDEMAERAAKEERTNARYNWLGEVAHDEALGLIARSRLMVLSSRHEGGPNALAEALALGTPVLATRIPGIVGVLGDEYPGYFDVEDTEGLARLLGRAAEDAGFLESLFEGCGARSELASPAREVDAWRDLLETL